MQEGLRGPGKGGPRKATDAAVRDAHARYRDGASLPLLVQELGYKNPGTLIAAFRRLGLPRLNQRGPAACVRLGDPRSVRALELWEAGATAKAAAAAVGISQTIMTRLLRETGRHGQRVGPAHAGWKGGGHHLENGYIRIWLDPGDPMAPMRDRTGQVAEHRLVMARHLGRCLERHETVHHINGNRGDNRIDNLQLRVGHHGPGRGYCCLDCGSLRIAPVAL